MKKYLIFVTSFCLIVSTLFHKVVAQAIPSHDTEKVIVMMERNLYIAGEDINFAASVLCVNENQKSESKVLYCELITPNGTRLGNAKFSIENSWAHGCIKIPDHTISGYYYLKAYTRVMRNNTSSSFSYTLLKIINPSISDVLGSENMLRADVVPVVSDFDSKSNLVVLTDSVVKRDQAIRLSLNADNFRDKGIHKATIGIVPAGSFIRYSFENEHSPNETSEFHYAENHGPTITGKLVDQQSKKAMADYIINLSLLGGVPDVMSTATDTTGRFFFSLPPVFGNQDIFISAEKRAEKTASLLIDNDYSPACAVLPSPVFHLTEQEQKTAIAIASSFRLKRYFGQPLQLPNDTMRLAHKQFYGTPSEVLVLDKYVQLPTLEEYFNELPTLVKIRKRQGEKYFKILENKSSLSIYPPLVLVDMIAIDDIDKILAIAPQAVEQIEVVAEPYIKGDFTYGGVISIISKKGDLAGIDLPATGSFLNYGFLNDNRLCDCCDKNDGSIPDARSTLLWNASLSDAEIQAEIITFRTSSLPGKFIIIIQAIDNKGNLIVETHPLDVQ